MTAKKYLEQIELIQWKIAQKTRELDRLKRLNRDDLKEKITVLEEEISADIASLYERRNEIVNRICELNNKLFIDILYRRYVCIFREICASVPKERSAIPLETERSSAD